MYLLIIGFLILLAVFDLIVGVSNDAVNFLSAAIGAKVARFRTIVLVAAVGVFLGAALSNGMMDVARHGIMTPMYFTFNDVICVFLAVMITDVVLLDIFNTLGLPTSTTVSMVFELLGGAFAIALLKIAAGAVNDAGEVLSLGDLINTEKAISVILGIFLSVAIAFVVGLLIQWVSRLIFTFTYRVNGRTTDVKGHMGGLTSSSLKIGVFSGIAVTAIVWFLLINGLKNSTLMTSEVKQYISQHTFVILGGGALVFSLLMTLLSALRLPVLKGVVLLGTFALAMAFAGNDLVNFVGVPLTGLEAYQDFQAHATTGADGFYMSSLMESAHTPTVYLMIAGVVMVLSLIFSKKAQNVVKTSVDLSSRDESTEMFGTSGVARTLVRQSTKVSGWVACLVPRSAARWVDSRFNVEASVLPRGAAFDQIRAAVNLVVAGILVAIGTSYKLPLSTTYVTFMVAMGTSLADRAWGRETAVFRITGVLSVIGGWFITAGAAFTLCYLVTNLMVFGQWPAMLIAIVVCLFLLIRSHLNYNKKGKQEDTDELFSEIVHSGDLAHNWLLLQQHVDRSTRLGLRFAMERYQTLTDAFFHEEYRGLRRLVPEIQMEHKTLKRMRRKEIIALRKIDPLLSIEKGTWYFLAHNSIGGMVYSLKRMNDPCLEHVAGNLPPVNAPYVDSFLAYRDEIVRLFRRVLEMPAIEEMNDLTARATTLRQDALEVSASLSNFRKSVMNDLQTKPVGIEAMTVLLNLLQESGELVSCLRHYLRGLYKFAE